MPPRRRASCTLHRTNPLAIDKQPFGANYRHTLSPLPSFFLTITHFSSLQPVLSVQNLALLLSISFLIARRILPRGA